MYQMANAASQQALEEGKKRLREFLEESNTGRQAMGMQSNEGIQMNKVNGYSKSGNPREEEDDDDI